ncbi:hypothetical protein ACFQY0_00350 [Haloferula chungangensis]|uniref:Uncharacterized protein n=2 Tax=Haloferula chungangensis TaxID=1048331 RepID=A0ABW2KZU2_9BACT
MRRIAIVSFLLCLPAQAGMTVITLTDAAKARLDVLSFFIVAYLLLGLAVKGLWNSLAKSSEKMPRLNYRRALALLLLSGLFLYVILTMISGARELLTPGAWEKQGVGYRLREASDTFETKEQRHQRLSKLRDAIWSHAEAHQGKPPSGPFSGEVPLSSWRLSDGNFYAYLKPETIGTGHEVLIYEPASSGPRRFILFTDGSIEDWAEGKLNSELKKRWER